MAKRGRPLHAVLPSWRPFIEACGGPSALAARLGVDPCTINRWSCKGQRLSPLALRVIRDVAKELGVAPPF
jgi:DNA-binding transcriptional regulator YdaS (Cro superfamily)